MTDLTAGPRPSPAADPGTPAAEDDAGGTAAEGDSGRPHQGTTGGAPACGGRSDDRTRRVDDRRRRTARAIRLGGLAVVLVWLAGMAAFSSMLYHRVDLTADYASYYQAWALIGQGHLNPVGTVWLHHVPFVRNDLELIIWALAPLHLLSSQGVLLLWVQDVAIAACGFVTFVWVVEVLERRAAATWVTVTAGVAVLAAVVANVGVYRTLLFDFHTEPISTLFVVLAGRDLWHGRTRRAWVWIPGALLCGTFAALMVIGLGISALLAGTRTRRSGLLLVGCGAAWSAFIPLVGTNLGSGLDYYAYLAGRTHLPATGGVVLVLLGIVGHPGRVLHQLHLRMHYIWLLLRPVGIVGLASAWGFGVPVTVLVVDALNSQYGFIFEPFQNFAVFPFVLVGTVMVLLWLADRIPRGWTVAALAGVVLAGVALTYDTAVAPGNVRWAVSRVPAGTAAHLRQALAATPPSAEVVATIGIMGRFSGRPEALFYSPGRTYAVGARPVVFVFAPAQEDTVPFATPADDDAAITYVRTVLHARTLVDAGGVAAFSWDPPPSVRSVRLPGATPQAASS